MNIAGESENGFNQGPDSSRLNSSWPCKAFDNKVEQIIFGNGLKFVLDVFVISDAKILNRGSCNLLITLLWEV